MATRTEAGSALLRKISRRSFLVLQALLLGAASVRKKETPSAKKPKRPIVWIGHI